MNNKPIAIVGAGLAGLIAAHAWPQARIYERQPRPRQSHAALLRFRSDAVARLTGIEFQRVRVRKGIWHRGAFVAPNIGVANRYSDKVLGTFAAERSIWNIDPVDRFIAPDNFYDLMLQGVGARIEWGVQAPLSDLVRNMGCDVISTAPLPDTLAHFEIDPSEHWPPARQQPIMFQRSPITVQKFRVSRCNVHQTIYFPDPDVEVYRASITGDVLIVEAMGEDAESMVQVIDAFNLEDRMLEPLGKVEQRYGKILDIEPALRKALVHRLTAEHGVFSLGRFATWRNLLLDDVVDDIAVLKRLMRASSYDLKRAAS